MLKLKKIITKDVQDKLHWGPLMAIISISLGMGISVFFNSGRQAEIFVTNPAVDGADLVLERNFTTNNHDLAADLIVNPNSNIVTGFDTQLEFNASVLQLDLTNFTSLKTDCWQLSTSNGYYVDIAKISDGHYDISVFTGVNQNGINSRQVVLTLYFNRLNQTNTGLSLLASKSIVAIEGYSQNGLRNVTGLNFTDNNNQTACEVAGGTWENFSNGCVDMCSLVTNPNQDCTQAITAGCNCGSTKCWNGTICVNNPTATSSPSVNQITIKTRLAGVNKKDHAINIRVTIYDSKNTTVKTDDTVAFGPTQIRFVSNTAGEYVSDPINFAYTNYSQISIELKGPKHLAEYISNINSATSSNLVSRPLAPGDLPWNNGVQDNKVDVKDIDAVESRLGATDQDNRNVADVNYDGIVDLMDRSMVLDTWYKFLQSQ